LENLTKYPLDILKFPTERNSHSSVFDPYINSIFIFGGGNLDGLNNELWEFSLNNSKWEKHPNKGNVPNGREMHSLIFYFNQLTKAKTIFLLGGRLKEDVSNEIFAYNLESKTWELFFSLPYKLCSFSAVIIKNFIVIYGGTDAVYFYNDIILLNIDTKKWFKSKIAPQEAEVGYGGKIATMSSCDEEFYIIFGGSSLSNDSNDIFILKHEELLDVNNLIEIKK